MTRLKDIVQQQATTAAVTNHLRHLAETCSSLAVELQRREDRSDRLVAYANFSLYVAGELRRTAIFYPNDVPGLAWTARNLFEAYLLVKYISQSDAKLLEWMGQGITDETDFIDGMLFCADPDESGTQIDMLQTQRVRLLDLAKRHNLQKVKPFRVVDLAKGLGEEEEYGALFKLFSKYVHPSSLYINKWALVHPDSAYVEIFQIKAQVYAGQAVKIIQDFARA
jgi:hypothetical protein